MNHQNKIEKELSQKEFENEIGKDLKLGYEELEAREKLFAGKNKYAIAAINFFGTLIACYAFYFVVRYMINFFFGTALGLLGVNMGWMIPLIHGVIWVMAVISVYRKRSVLEDIIERF